MTPNDVRAAEARLRDSPGKPGAADRQAAFHDDRETLARHDLALADACRRLLAAERRMLAQAVSGSETSQAAARLEYQAALADIGRLVGDAGEG